MSRYVLPRDTLAAFHAGRAACRNPGLLFDRYLPYIEGPEDKTRAVEMVLGCRADKDLVAAHLARWRQLAEGEGAAPFRAYTEWRFITGLGRKGALEVGFHFHALYGFPVIPGSGLKGLARAAAELLEGKDEGDRAFAAVFGRAPRPGNPPLAGEAGHAVFFDAAPAEPVTLLRDVINPHYPGYYREANRQPPANWQSPIPVPLFTIGPNTAFWFAVGWRGKRDEAAQRQAVAWLQRGLCELGAGAKTSAGYGCWRIEP